MTKAQTREYKQANQRRKRLIWAVSYGKKKDKGNLCVALGGLIQDGKYTKERPIQ